MATTILSFKLRDSESHTTSMPLHFNASEVDTVAKAQGIATDLAALLSAVTGCGVVGAEVMFPVTVPADTPDSDARNDAGATLSFYNSAGRGYSLYVPGWRGTYLAAGKVTYNDVSPDNPWLFIDALLTGTGITGAYDITDGNGLDIASFRLGAQATRRRLKTR